MDVKFASSTNLVPPLAIIRFIALNTMIQIVRLMHINRNFDPSDIDKARYKRKRFDMVKMNDTPINNIAWRNGRMERIFLIGI